MSIQILYVAGEKKENLEVGTIAEIDWERLRPYFEKAFVMRENEILIGITVTETGIKAKFKIK